MKQYRPGLHVYRNFLSRAQSGAAEFRNTRTVTVRKHIAPVKSNGYVESKDVCRRCAPFVEKARAGETASTNIVI